MLGSSPSDKPKVDLGSWARAKDYVQDILEVKYSLL